MKNFLLASVAYLMSVCVAAGPVYAGYEVSPITLELQTGGSKATGTLTIKNLEDKQLPLEIKVLRRSVDRNGRQTEASAENDLIVLPPLATVAPSSTQAFRIQYSGPPLITGQSYYVTIAQLPLDIGSTEKSGLRFLLNFNASVYVNAPNARAQVNVKEIATGKQPGTLRVLLENTGDKTFSLATGTMLLTDKSGKEFSWNREMKVDEPQSFLMQGRMTRYIVVAMPKGVSPGDVVSARYVQDQVN